MVDATAMSTPITRGELREEIERLEIRFDQLEIRFEQKLELLEQKLEQNFDQKLEQLEQNFDQKLEKKFDQKLAPMATKADLEIWGGALFERLLTELARHVKAAQESLPIQVSAIDDKYADLPARVSCLETAVFAPKAR